jgi:hypothetical protein
MDQKYQICGSSPKSKLVARTLHRSFPDVSIVEMENGSNYGGLNLPGSTPSYPISNFVYLFSDVLAPAFLRMAKSAPPATRPPNKAMITMGMN